MFTPSLSRVANPKHSAEANQELASEPKAPAGHSLSGFAEKFLGPVVAYFSSTRFQIPAALKNREQLIRAVKPLAPLTAENGGPTTALTAFWVGVASLFGTAVGAVAAGPGSAMVPLKSNLDTKQERIGKLLSPNEQLILNRFVENHPTFNTTVTQALELPSPKEQREALKAFIRVIIRPGEAIRVEDTDGNILFEQQDSRAGDRALLVMASEEEKRANACPSDMVFVPEGNYEGQIFSAICVDEHEYSLVDHVPLTQVNYYEAKFICSTIGRRLPHSKEWARIASQNGTQKYSTRSGEFFQENQARVLAIHWKQASKPREVCAARGAYVQYNGREICDLNGNVEEWTSDQYVVGGSIVDTYPPNLQANTRNFLDLERGKDTVGFRCVTSPQE